MLAAITWFVLEPARDAVLPVLLAPDRPAASALARLALASLAPWQAGLVVLAAGLGVGILLLERRGRPLSRLLAGPPGPMLVACAAAGLWLGHGYIGHGVLLSGDTIAHMAMLRDRIAAVRAGQDPTWTNLTYLGLPLQAFYAPTTFWPLLQAALLTGAPDATLRGFLFAMHALSGLAGYALARRLGTSRFGAAMAALVYAGSFAHLHLLLYRGALPQALSAVLLPLALLFVREVALRPVRPDPRWLGAWLGLVLSAAGLAINYTPLAVLVGVHMAVLAAACLARRGGRAARTAALLAAAAAAAGLAACVLLPAAMAGSEVLPLSPLHLLSLRWPGLDYVGQLLLWRAWRTDFPGGAAYLGLVAVALAATAAWRLARDPGRNPGRGAAVRTLVALLALSFVLRGLHVRDIMPTVLYVALLAGEAAAHLATLPRLGPSAPALVAGLLLLDLGSTAIQPVGRTDKGWLEAAGATLAAAVPPTRTLELQVHGGRAEAVPGPGIMAWSGAEFLGAGHVEMATPAWVHADLAAFMAEADLDATGTLSPRTTDLLCLLRVGRIVGVGRDRLGLPPGIAAARDEPGLGRVVQPDCRYRIVFAPTLLVAGTPGINPGPDPRVDYRARHAASLIPAEAAFLDALLAIMRLDRRTGGADALVLRPGSEPASGPALRPEAGVSVRDYRVSTGRIDIALDAPAAGFVRLSHAWHPRVRVTDDGQAIRALADVTGCLVVPIHAGANTLRIAPMPDVWQRIGERVSLAVLLGLAGLAAAAALLSRPWRLARGLRRPA